MYRVTVLVIEDAQTDNDYFMYYYDEPTESEVRMEFWQLYPDEHVWKVVIDDEWADYV